MTGALLSLGILSLLFCCGFYGASLALRDLREMRPPRLGLSYWLYVGASQAYAMRREVVPAKTRFPATRVLIARRQGVVATRRPAPCSLEGRSNVSAS